MASKYLQKFPVPAGFQEILADFTQEVLRDQPASIIEYAAQYFEMLEKGKKLNYQGGSRKPDSSLQAKQADQITKKAAHIANGIGSTQEATKPEKTIHVIGTEKTVNSDEVGKYIKSLPSELEIQMAEEERTQKEKAELSKKIDEVVDQVFEEFDKDGSKQLNSNEAKAFIKAVMEKIGLKQEINEENVQKFVSYVDTNHDGRISAQELTKFIKTLFETLIQ